MITSFTQNQQNPSNSPESESERAIGPVMKSVYSLDEKVKDTSARALGSEDNQKDKTDTNNITHADEDDDDDDYEEALVYIELPDFQGQSYLNQAKKIVLQGLGETKFNSSPTMVVDGTEFKGTHMVNLGSNHFFACTSSSTSSSSSSTTTTDSATDSSADISSSVAGAYRGHSIKTTEFTLSRVHIPSAK